MALCCLPMLIVTQYQRLFLLYIGHKISLFAEKTGKKQLYTEGSSIEDFKFTKV
jgi:hypothetical protein